MLLMPNVMPSAGALSKSVQTPLSNGAYSRDLAAYVHPILGERRE